VVSTFSQLLPGADTVVNALGLRTKAFIVGMVQRRWTPWSKPKQGFDNYHKNSNHTILFLKRIVSIIKQKLNKLAQCFTDK
jgi:hypothetical protein